MSTLLIVIFALGYLAIALEHNIKVDKAAAALITGVLCWTVLMDGASDILTLNTIPHPIELEMKESGQWGNLIDTLNAYLTEYAILEHLAEISSILFFLMGAMTIVELVDAHDGFRVITDRIKTREKRKLLWIICILTFFMSAALDNLTTSIVMISLLRKLIENRNDRWFFAGMVVIAANAGGVWSPIGDVTTTMLWIGKQITTERVIVELFLPGLLGVIVPLTIASFNIKGHVNRPIIRRTVESYSDPTTPMERKIVFTLGLLGLLFVPVFKTLTHLPPFMGMMLSLGVLWAVTELMHRSKNQQIKAQLSVITTLRKIDTASVLFFLGILLAVGALQTAGELAQLAGFLESSIGTDHEAGIYGIGVIIGLLSAIIDNVPLVAASMGMYDISPVAGSFFSQDGLFWEFLALCAGTGGSALIIGSASGVAVMGLEKIPFGWYLRKVSVLALIGYLAGVAAYIVEETLLGL